MVEPASEGARDEGPGDGGDQVRRDRRDRPGDWGGAQRTRLGHHGGPPEQVQAIDDYDAVVLGSAVYAGHWLTPAREFVDRCRDALAARPVWLFSSGPIGDPPKPEEDPVDVAEILQATKAREHRLFAGKLVKKQLRFPDRAIAAALRVPEGDFRDWDEVKGWAAGIADAQRPRS